MFKDVANNSLLNSRLKLSVDSNHEIATILSFIDNVIGNFRSYYIDQGSPYRENRISDLLVNYLQYHKSQLSDGFWPFDFRKNPTQPSSGKETDIGVFFIALNTQPLVPIIEFEAKRLSNKSNRTPHNTEYVYGKRGGMERFKRGEHSPHLIECGMFGYIQNRNANYWVDKINNWIEEAQAKSELDWSNKKECLAFSQNILTVSKYSSENKRARDLPSIKLWHYMLDLS